MYSFRIKADAADIDVPTVRSLLVFAAIILAISRNNNTYVLNIIASIVFIAAAFFAEVILVKHRVHPFIITGIAAVLLAICTFNLVFPAAVMAIAFIARYFYVHPVVEIEEKGIRLKRSFSNKMYDWPAFNNVVLKDGLLSLDFKNNKLLQLELDSTARADEQQFNVFCANKINS